LIGRSCIPALLSAKRLKSDALEARDLGFEEAEVQKTGTLEVFPRDVVDARGVDAEERHRPAVDVPDHDLMQLAAAHEAESP
jgi:hypothetical protein